MGQRWLLEALWLGTPGLQLGLCRHKFLWSPSWLQIVRGVTTDTMQLWPVKSSRPSAIGWTRVNSMCAQGREQGSRGRWGAAPTFLPGTLPPTSELGSPRPRGPHSMHPHNKAMVVAGLSCLRWGCSREHRKTVWQWSSWAGCQNGKRRAAGSNSSRSVVISTRRVGKLSSGWPGAPQAGLNARILLYPSHPELCYVCRQSRELR